MSELSYISDEIISQHLVMSQVIGLMEDIFANREKGSMPPKIYLELDPNDFRAMPAKFDLSLDPQFD